MILKPDKRVLSALSTLQNDQDFQTVIEHLKVSLETLKQDSAYQKDETLLRWNQGATQALGELLQLAQDSRDLLYKIRG